MSWKWCNCGARTGAVTACVRVPVCMCACVCVCVQPQLTPQVVIGLWHCPSFPSVTSACERFDRIVSNIRPAPIVTRLFGFDASGEALADPVSVALRC